VRGVNVDVVYKDIKNLHIGVYPPLGRVRVAAPLSFDDDRVRLAVIQRFPWIVKQRKQLQEVERQSERDVVTGESHYVWGVRMLLRLVERPGPAKVTVVGQRLVMHVPPGTGSERRRAVLAAWRREQLRESIPGLLATWEPVIGVEAARWTIRRMRTKWGSCSRANGHISINLELAGKHPALLEYIVVHELVHLRERGHGDRFTRLMDAYLPGWRAKQTALNDSTLAAEDWPG
jgi:predicted metal-dependent hydrolase